MRWKIVAGFLVTGVVIWFGWAAATRDTRKNVTVAIATKSLARYQVITEADVTMERRRSPQKNAATAREAVVDKLLLNDVPEDATISSTDVVSPEVVEGRSLLDVEITSSGEAPGEGDTVLLVVSPKSEGFAGFVLRDVRVVRVNKSTTTVALLPADLDRLSDVLAVSQLRFAPTPITLG
jgi:hypothetical protein